MPGTKLMKKFYTCRCFYTKNIFLKDFGIHIHYDDKKKFLTNFGEVLRSRGCDTDEKVEDVIKQIEKEIDRRKSLGEVSVRRRKIISEKYTPLHLEVYNLKEDYLAPEFLELVAYCRTGNASVDGVKQRVEGWKAGRLYMFCVFEKKFCDLLLEELDHFESSDCPKGRPNTMNKYGVLLSELGFDDGLLSPFLEKYLTPITTVLYPDWGGDSLDSYKAFTVKYKVGEDLDLDYHYDNAEITLNVALGKDFTEGTLYFGDMRTERKSNPSYLQYEHRTQFGLLHRGQHLHGAMPIEEGERWNLIIWMRSSKVRNQKCPMCDEKPDLVESVGFGDGFTRDDQVVNVCSTF